MGAPQIQYAIPAGGGVPVGVSGTGTVSRLAKFTAATTIADSGISDDGTTVSFISRNLASTTAQTWTLASSTSALNIASGQLNIDTSGGNVSSTFSTGADISILIKNSGAGRALFAADAGGTSASEMRFRQGGVDKFRLIANGATSFSLYDSTASAYRWFVDSSGNVGFGTASPQEKTQVYGDLKIGVTASNSFLTFGDEGTTSKFNGIYRPASSNTLALGSYNLITFNVSAAALGSQTERMRIDSSGTLCVGTNVSATSLNKLIVADGNNGKGYEVRPGATCQILAYDRTAGAYLPNSLSALSHTFSVSGNNAVVVGASSMDASALAGYGLKLPATPGNADSQTLDCYAEGTWAPTLTGFGGTAPTVTVARYTRVGRVITIQICLSATGGATYSGTRTTTYVNLPSGMTPAVSTAGMMTDSAVQTLGTGAAYTNGNLYWPTFAATSADTFLTVTYTV